MALCALAITAGVSVLTRLLPPAATAPDAPPAFSSNVAASASDRGTVADDAVLTPAPAPVPAPRSAALEQLTGTWTGLARLGAQRLPITLVVTSSCTEGHACGTLSTDGPACVGNLTLVGMVEGPVFEFGVRTFAPGSSPACEPHEDGEVFVLGDDVLAYHSEFGQGAVGRLTRVR